jgi:glycosyltransferase involved in cell wall biosynthesis
LLQTRGLCDLRAGLISVIAHTDAKQRARREREIFRLNRYFIGRTDFDRRTTERMAPNLRQYHCCWEIMRPVFYQRSHLGAAPSSPRLFACGRDSPYKGGEELVRLMGRLRDRYPGISLRIAGPYNLGCGWGRHLRALAHRLGVADRVQFLGYCAAGQIADELEQASAYLHPTYVDNSPNSLAEAMCMGVPCVASATGGIPSMVSDGQTGLLFDIQDQDQFCSQVCRVLDDPGLGRRLGAAAMETARRRHDPATIADTLVKIYQTVVAAGRG